MTPPTLEIVLVCAGGFVALVLLWLAYAKIRIELAAAAHDNWRSVADDLGLEVHDSNDLDAPILRGEIDGVAVEVRPTTEDRKYHRGDNDHLRQQTTIEADLPDPVPADGLAFKSVRRVLPVASERGPRVAWNLDQYYDFDESDDRVDALREDERAAEALAELRDQSSRVEFRDGTFTVEVDRNVRSADTLADILEAVTAAAEGIRHATDDPATSSESTASDRPSGHW